MTDFNLIPLLPEIFVLLNAMGLLLAGVYSRSENTPRVICWAGIVVLLIAALLAGQTGHATSFVLSGMFKFNGFTQYMKLLVMLGLAAVLALSAGSMKNEGTERFEFPVLMLIAGAGMLLLISSNNFLTFYMALELQSLSLYVLAAMKRNSLFSAEAGVKYFTLGALSSGMILFGISLLYGFTGTIDFGALSATLITWGHVPLGVTFGMIFVLAGLAFKISAFPFHMWTPDVYQGAPTIVTALFAIVPKVAAIAIMIRVLYEPFNMMSSQWIQIVYLLSLGSMIVGAFAGLRQNDIKRLLAYSSIGNIGFALVGVVATSLEGIGGTILYMLIYMLGTAGTFSIVLSMRRGGVGQYNINDLAGLSQTQPVTAYCLAILMFSMSGIPPMAGFFGKLFVFKAAMAAGFYWLAVLGVITSVVAAYYYLRIIKVMFFDDAKEPFDQNMPFARQVVLYISVAFTLLFIIKPSFIFDMTQGAVQALFFG